MSETEIDAENAAGECALTVPADCIAKITVKNMGKISTKKPFSNIFGEIFQPQAKCPSRGIPQACACAQLKLFGFRPINFHLHTFTGIENAEF